MIPICIVDGIGTYSHTRLRWYCILYHIKVDSTTVYDTQILSPLPLESDLCWLERTQKILERCESILFARCVLVRTSTSWFLQRGVLQRDPPMESMDCSVLLSLSCKVEATFDVPGFVSLPFLLAI